MGKERIDLGFGDALDDFDPAEWKPAKPKAANDRPKTDEVAKAAKSAGFASREVKEKTATVGQGAPRRRRTGRNAQFNLKAKPETIEAYCAIADNQGWGLGETLEHAVALLEREYARKT